MKQQWALTTLAVALGLILSGWALPGGALAGHALVGDRSFHSGQHFSYTLEMGDNCILGTGAVAFWVHEAADGYWDMLVEGSFRGEFFQTLVAAPTNDLVTLYSNLNEALYYDAPKRVWDSNHAWELLQLLFTGSQRFTSLAEPRHVGEILFEQDALGNVIWITVPEKRTYASEEGYFVRIEHDVDGPLLEFVLSPRLPLPLLAVQAESSHSRTTTGEMYMRAVLQTYASEVPVPNIAVSPRASLQRKLQNVIAHLRDHGVSVGRSLTMIHEMVGATAGIHVKLNGQFIELYAFDPHTITVETLHLLEEARATGTFLAVPLQKELPVVLNGFLMMVVPHARLREQHRPGTLLERLFLAY